MNTRPIVVRLSGGLVAAAIGLPVFASGGGGGGGGGMTTLDSKPGAADPRYARAVAEIAAGHYALAATLLEAYVGHNQAGADNADAQNWLGYAYRKSGNLDAAFLHYDKALAIDPRHRGAHEYLGEAYLMVGNLPQAEEHLKILDKLCWTPCTEYSQLKSAVLAYRSAHAQTP